MSFRKKSLQEELFFAHFLNFKARSQPKACLGQLMMKAMMVMMMMVMKSERGEVWLGANCLGDRRQPFVAQRVPVPRGKGAKAYFGFLGPALLGFS